VKLNSKYFDRIRVKPDKDRLRPPEFPACEWAGCRDDGTHRAPKGRDRDGEYFHFCIDHVREYNRGYNYFEGMTDDDVISYQKSALTGHRPTWSLGLNRLRGHHGAATRAAAEDGFADPFGAFSDEEPAPQRKPIRNAERKALSTLGLDETAEGPEIKARYKTLVKRHHPDANGGAKSAEEKLREIIQAYSYLKSVGFC
jgi:curved DNA-binding protein CbpA